jgi:flavin reductase (DIM6/NTAB) family NADH-FMN oxidoreductase RutF
VIGADDFRLLLGHFASGVTVVTARDSQGRPAGLTASAFTSVSLNPPLILVCVAQDAQSYEALRGADRFAVNILDRGQQALSNRFATKSSTAAEKFEGIGHKSGVLGLPILDDALAYLECTTVHAYPGGDHTIFVGQIEAGASRDGDEAEPLLYYRGRYRHLSSPGGSL